MHVYIFLVCCLSSFIFFPQTAKLFHYTEYWFPNVICYHIYPKKYYLLPKKYV